MTSAPGSRRLSLTMLALRERADRFAGAPAGAARPLSLLAAFQEAEPYLGLPPQAFKLVAWLVKMTQPRDWEAGSRPIAWPSAARQQEHLGLTASAAKLIFYSWSGAASRNALASLGWVSEFAYRCSATFSLILLDFC
jgi:replication initiation protein RepC